ncbi:GTP 3',8-cyclase MoaA [Martelella alba]|uniref:GTP 3',8-cyclase n=1 Tax=Martelella alba TaxID=2590451 RepID=A0A506U4X5_9HYPH|nr:GTP 3',8-cyclase MoaA [Martelella alba]TPW28005.1 GTP 3',8-cyclase MoaA [Martelella alba]
MDTSLLAPEKPVTNRKRAPLIDNFGRTISYLRVSVTDRCDFRCTYCMAENMTFLPKRDLLTLEEMERLCNAFIDRGVTKLRLTGGEPLVRKNVMHLFEGLGKRLGNGLDELTLTTNGSQLHRYAGSLFDAGIRRVNVSLDTLDPEKFRAITRWGDLEKVLHGLRAARQAGLKVKLNAVALAGVNEQEIPTLMEFAHGEGMELTLIEAMPLGEVDQDRSAQYLPLSKVRASLAERYTLDESPHATGGPARFVTVAETGGRLGFITPLSHNFCSSCNRVRLTCTGMLYLCLGQDDNADFRKVLRETDDEDVLHAAIDRAISLKPLEHNFELDEHRSKVAVKRHMNVTGG